VFYKLYDALGGAHNIFGEFLKLMQIIVKVCLVLKTLKSKMGVGFNVF
jgi:hypothetical protein